MFAGDWLPIPLEDYTMFLEDAVQPFVARLGLTSPSETIPFAGDWLPIPLEDYTMFLEDAVQPFVARLGLTSPSETIPNEGMKPDQHHAR